MLKNTRLLIIIGLVIHFNSFAAAATKEYSLVIAKETVNITGEPLNRITINGSIPGPTLEFTDGDEAVIHVTNTMKVDSSVHWHGLLLPGMMDGVPGFNGYPGIKPGETFTYRFNIRQDGTYWYHAHSMVQEQDGHYGSIIIHPKSGNAEQVDRDYVVLLSDFHQDEGMTIMSNLKKSSEYYVYVRRTLGDFFSSVKEDGFGKAWKNAKMWGQMRMLPTDLADISDYTFLVNGKTPDQNWTGLFKAGEKIRLRFINASAMSFYDVRIPGLEMKVVSADGQPVEPVMVDEFRFGVSETYDVIVQPSRNKAYSIVAESIDRTGFALATLAPHEGMRGALPAHRPMSLLTMADMGHDMHGMDHSSHSDHDMQAMDHGNHSDHDMHGMDHSSHSDHDMQAMDHGNHSDHDMHGMDHSSHSNHDMQAMDHGNHSDHDMHGMDHSSHSDHDMQAMDHGNHSDHDMHGMDHSSHSDHDMQAMDHGNHSDHDMHGMDHSSTDHAPVTTNPTNAPAADFETGVPGSGWANAHTPDGHKALSYKDLRYLGTQQDLRMPEREIVLRLGGNMERYIWTLNDKKYEDSGPINLEYGERVRLTFINSTMMAHPMHLHGMFVQLENGQPMSKLPNKHTVIVAPGDTYSVLLTADEAGEWAFHCHLLYHMMAGMMNKVVVAQLDEANMPTTSYSEQATQDKTVHSNIKSKETLGEHSHDH
jgi:CopA family copper-resistance protein